MKVPGWAGLGSSSQYGKSKTLPPIWNKLLRLSPRDWLAH